MIAESIVLAANNMNFEQFKQIATIASFNELGRASQNDFFFQ